jgi:predicted transport protein
LASEEGMEILSNEIGIQLKALGTEEQVGKYSLDILAEDSRNGDKVVIENQFGETDHDHIGKLFTYAAGFDAKILILIAEKFTSEHRAALDFVNNNSEIKVFALEIKVKQVNENDFIPEFDIVSSPNDWTETMKENEKKKGRGWGRSNPNPWRPVEEHRKDAGLPNIFDILRKYILELKDVEEESRSRVIYYKHDGKKFASITTTKNNGIYLGLNVDITTLEEIPDFGRDLTGIGKLDAGDLRLQIHNEKQFEESKKFIEIAYNK